MTKKLEKSDVIELSLQSFDQRITRLELNVNDIQEKHQLINSLQTEVTDLKRSTKTLEANLEAAIKAVDNLEQYGRRNSLRFSIVSRRMT